MNLFKEDIGSEAVIIISAGLYNIFVNLLAFCAFHPLLPSLVRVALNLSDEVHLNSTFDNIDYDKTSEKNVATAIGLVTGTGSISVVVASILSGYLIRTLPYRVSMVSCSLITLATPLLCCYATSLILLCVANVLINFSITLIYVAVFTAFARLIVNDCDRNKIINISTIIGSIAQILGYSVVSVVYEFYGRDVTFLCVAALCALNAIFAAIVPMTSAPKSLGAVEKSAEDPLNDGCVVPDEAEEPLEEPCVTFVTNAEPTLCQRFRGALYQQMRIVSNMHIQFAVLQMFMLYAAIGTLWTTGPEWVMRHLNADQWETGVIMGCGAASEIAGVTIVSVLVTSPRRRWFTLILSMSIAGLGYMTYPFPRVVWLLLPAEIAIRCSKAITFSLIVSIFPYIFDVHKLYNYELGYGLLSMGWATGTIAGAFGSVSILNSIGFLWLYVIVGTSLIVVSTTAFYFRRMESFILSSENREGIL